jgi:tetratricopeptide (TPR) repeat protein
MRASLLNAEQRGSPSFYALYRLATVELPDGRPDAAALALAERRLQKAVELNPFHAESLASLAHVVALGPPESRLRAVPMAQKAVTLDPGDAFVRATIARALWNAGQRDVAMQQAQTALRLATNDQARQNAQQLIDFFTKSASAPR